MTPARTLTLLLLSGFAALALPTSGCTRIGFDLPPDGGGGGSRRDGPASADAPASDASSPSGIRCRWDVPFTLVDIAPVTAASNDDWNGEPVLAPNWLRLYLANAGPRAGRGVYYVERPTLDAPFSAPRRLWPPSGDFTDPTRLSFTANGLVAFLAARISSPSDLYVARRSSSTTPLRAQMFEPIGALNTSGAEYDPLPNVDGTRLYYASERPGRELDLFVATLDGAGAYGNPRPLAGLNTAAVEDNPSVSRDERVMLFGSKRPGAPNGHATYFVTRSGPDRPFGEARLAPEINQGRGAREAYLRPDGCEVFFSSVTGGVSIYRARYKAL